MCPCSICGSPGHWEEKCPDTHIACRDEIASLRQRLSAAEKERDAARAKIKEARKALSHYARRYENGCVWNWHEVVCDRMSGLVAHFDWKGEEQDEPHEVAERALEMLSPKLSPPPKECAHDFKPSYPGGDWKQCTFCGLTKEIPAPPTPEGKEN